MKYTTANLRLKLMDCIGNDITSKELGDWTYDAWHHHNKSKKGYNKLIVLLLEISSEWGMLSASEESANFSKEFLKEKLKELEDFMNIEKEEEFGF